jgi:hemerythrin
MKHEWTEAMSTGDAALDDEHRILIAWINRLSDANAEGRFELEVRRILDFLGAYAARHFSHEEACFARHQCPHAAANRKAHEEFVVRFAEIKAECDARGVTEARALDLHRWLGGWLSNHILKTDTALRACVER